jgi:hypothetical protein
MELVARLRGLEGSVVAQADASRRASELRARAEQTETE